MKKIVIGLLAGAIALSMAACSSGVSQAEYDKVVSERDALQAELDALSGGETTKAEKKEAPAEKEKAETQSEIGSRKNAAKLGDTVTYEMDSIMYGTATLEITMTELLRGQEAADFIAQANQFNDPAPDGQEYVLATFKLVNVQNKSEEDQPLEVNSAQFSYADSKFTKEDQLNIVTTGKDLRAELYEGSETEGDVVLISAAGDAGYAVYDDAVWFSLS